MTAVCSPFYIGGWSRSAIKQNDMKLRMQELNAPLAVMIHAIADHDAIACKVNSCSRSLQRWSTVEYILMTCRILSM